MNHTFILQPGEWAAAGMMQDADGRETAMKGATRIIHDQDAWRNESAVAPLDGGGSEIVNTYVIEPPDNPGAPMRWTSTNPAIGALRGRFVFVDDTIVSVFDSEDGLHSGTELLKQVAEDRYVNVGVLLKQGNKAASWAYELHRNA